MLRCNYIPLLSTSLLLHCYEISVLMEKSQICYALDSTEMEFYLFFLTDNPGCSSTDGILSTDGKIYVRPIQHDTLQQGSVQSGSAN